MPDEIQPALTPEEWAKERAMLEEYMGRDTSVSLVRSPDATYFVLHAHDGWRGERNTAAVLATPHHLTRIMALANAALSDDDARKITRAKIEKLRELVQYAAGAYTFQAEAEAVGRDAAEAERFLAALAALLPPDE